MRSPDTRPRNYVRGERHPRAKLSDADARELFALRGRDWTQAEAAELFGLTRQAVSLIWRAERWRHLHDEESECGS